MPPLQERRMMKGIIMSGNHPKLILDGVKTQTRRTAGLNETRFIVFGNEDVYPFGPPDEMDSAIPFFTGDTEEQAFPGGYDTQGRVRVASYDPLPLTILAIMYEVRVKD